jgi:hypothetical protein
MSEKLFYVVPVRLADSQLKRIDRVVERHNERTGQQIGRAAMIRGLIELGLRVEEMKKV